MGVPAFFRWLSMKYPSIVSHCVEKRGQIVDDVGTRVSIDTTEPNPNGEEFDNLYLDMNGIIHPCTHPENKAAPKNEAEMFVAIFEYMDRLFAIIRPRRVLYMAIDGVAPRAKMNQQRSRRFRAAKESGEKLLTMERLREDLLARGAFLPPGKDKSEHFDSNCITPGTPFMARLAVALRYYIYDRLNSDPGWKDLLVFLSDANVPGEGEHKIMDYIRRQRNNPDHDPNTRHCLCGADADLIMLGLATHEPYFTIIREEFVPNQPRPCDLCGQLGHEMADCVGAIKTEFDHGPPPVSGAEANFIFIRLNVLREYLAKDLQFSGLSFEWDLERVIDDWVFMCFFVGNDFLPHLPSLEIREGAIDRLIEIYKSTLQSSDGWLTDSGRVNMPRVQTILTELGKMEDEIFKKRRESELDFRKRKRGNRNSYNSGSRPQRVDHKPSWGPPTPHTSGLLEPVPLGGRYGVAHPRGRYQGSSVSATDVHQARQFHNDSNDVSWVDRNLNNLEAATAMKAMLRPRQSCQKSKFSEGDDDRDDSEGPSPSRRSRFALDCKQGILGGAGAAAINNAFPKSEGHDLDDVTDANDEVRLWEDGWRERYYQSKFGVDPEDAPEFCIQVGREYARGLCWVLAYYYQGCASWDWYFPYHYAPFASDFVGISDLDPGFDKVETKPFCPLEQLMGVFPADSRSHVPPAWQDLMTDPDSNIIDFYPTNFKVDLNGKRFLWMGVALLPFVDEVRLLKELDARRHLLTKDELDRNIRGPDRLFCRSTHPLSPLLETLYEKPAPVDQKMDKNGVVPESADVLDPRLTIGVCGRIWPDFKFAHLPGNPVPSGVPSLLPDLKGSQAISVCFADLSYPSGFVFKAELLKSVKMPPPTELQPPQRGRGRGGPRGGGSSYDSNSRRFNSESKMNYYARESSSDHHGNGQDFSYSNPMHRMIQHSLPRQPYQNNYDNYNFRGSRPPRRSHYAPSQMDRYNSQQSYGNPLHTHFYTDGNDVHRSVSAYANIAFRPPYTSNPVGPRTSYPSSRPYGRAWRQSNYR